VLQKLSRNHYERRAWVPKHRDKELCRRGTAPGYAAAIVALSQAGTWKTGDAGVLEAMGATVVQHLHAMRTTLVEDKALAEEKMLTLRKKRTVLDQAAKRMVCPKGVEHRRDQGVVVGFGNGSWRNRGPRLQLLKALLRALKQHRASTGCRALLAMVPEYNTTKCCHKCLGTMQVMYEVTTDGRIRESRNFRACPACGTQAAPKVRSRDFNAALNMLTKLEAILRGTECPAALRPPGAAAEG
jgi:hypothetical protein